MRYRILIVLVVVLAACGGDTAGPVSTTEPSPRTSVPDAPASTTAVTEQSTTTAVSSNDETTTTRPGPNPGRMVAPDFTLTLSDGTEYQLANETRPVYMVFWAEW